MPVWHASLSRAGKSRGSATHPRITRPPTLTEFWSENQLKRAVHIGKRLMFGRGDPPFNVQVGTIAVHVRRKVSEADRSELKPEWLMASAVDVAGSGVRIPWLEFELPTKE